MSPAATVTVEFFGIPRQRAGRAELAVEADTLLQALAAVQRACPGLTGLVRPDGRLAPHYLVSVDGRRFVSEAEERLPAGARLLLLSADAGG
jgi:molybdopterin converting factor small subunit